MDRRRREDTRDHKPSYQQRSRSPPRRDRRDDQRRDRSPLKPNTPRGPPPRRNNARDRDREPENPRGRDRDTREPPPPRHPQSRQLDSRQNVSAPKGSQGVNQDVRVQRAIEDEDLDGMLQQAMGFSTFRSTKNTKVPGNDKNYAVYKVKKTEYRQYMNRAGGFNRPLSPTRM